MNSTNQKQRKEKRKQQFILLLEALVDCSYDSDEEPYKLLKLPTNFVDSSNSKLTVRGTLKQIESVVNAFIQKKKQEEIELLKKQYSKLDFCQKKILPIAVLDELLEELVNLGFIVDERPSDESQGRKQRKFYFCNISVTQEFSKIREMIEDRWSDLSGNFNASVECIINLAKRLVKQGYFIECLTFDLSKISHNTFQLKITGKLKNISDSSESRIEQTHKFTID